MTFAIVGLLIVAVLALVVRPEKFVRSRTYRSLGVGDGFQSWADLEIHLDLAGDEDRSWATFRVSLDHRGLVGITCVLDLDRFFQSGDHDGALSTHEVRTCALSVATATELMARGVVRAHWSSTIPRFAASRRPPDVVCSPPTTSTPRIEPPWNCSSSSL